MAAANIAIPPAIAVSGPSGSAKPNVVEQIKSAKTASASGDAAMAAFLAREFEQEGCLSQKDAMAICEARKSAQIAGNKKRMPKRVWQHSNAVVAPGVQVAGLIQKSNGAQGNCAFNAAQGYIMAENSAATEKQRARGFDQEGALLRFQVAQQIDRFEATLTSPSQINDSLFQSLILTPEATKKNRKRAKNQINLMTKPNVLRTLKSRPDFDADKNPQDKLALYKTLLKEYAKYLRTGGHWNNHLGDLTVFSLAAALGRPIVVVRAHGPASNDTVSTVPEIIVQPGDGGFPVNQRSGDNKNPVYLCHSEERKHFNFLEPDKAPFKYDAKNRSICLYSDKHHKTTLKSSQALNDAKATSVLAAVPDTPPPSTTTVVTIEPA